MRQKPLGQQLAEVEIALLVFNQQDQMMPIFQSDLRADNWFDTFFLAGCIESDCPIQAVVIGKSQSLVSHLGCFLD